MGTQQKGPGQVRPQSAPDIAWEAFQCPREGWQEDLSPREVLRWKAAFLPPHAGLEKGD